MDSTEWVIEVDETDPEPTPVWPAAHHAPRRKGFVFTGRIGDYDCYEKDGNTHIFKDRTYIRMLKGSIYDHVDVMCKLSKPE